MTANEMQQSTAPHFYRASTAPLPTVLNSSLKDSDRTRYVLWQSAIAETGIWQATPGTAPLHLERDELCYIVEGEAVYQSEVEGAIAVKADTLIHLKAGWQGRITIKQPVRASYIQVAGGTLKQTSVLQSPSLVQEVKDWGAIPAFSEASSAVVEPSHTSGVLLSREPDRRNESGLWICTPGRWRCEVTSDEYCHFLQGRCTYAHASGEVIEIKPDTLALFPKGWQGVCTVHETLRKVYLIH